MTFSRVHVDESSFCFAERGSQEIADTLGHFADTLRTVMAVTSVGIWDEWADWDCLPSTKLGDLLFAARDKLDRDVGLRVGLLFDKCQEWPQDLESLDVSIAGGEELFAPTVSYAHHLRRSGIAAACLVLDISQRRGFMPVSAEGNDQEIYFFSEPEKAKDFWRSIYVVEDVPEESFFIWTELAFPDLDFAAGLTFSKFVGKYRDLRKPVLAILATINDDFLALIKQCRGQSDRVAAEFVARCGYRVSRESVRTHANPKAMQQRVVTFNDKEVVCEWHAKIEPTRNRIYFALSDGSPGSRVLIGIFVDHLDT